jgi:DNA mismatch repair ATPase MutL
MALTPEQQKIWDKTMPNNLEVLYEETHTYEQMLSAIPDDFVDDLKEWLDQEGLDLPSNSDEDEDEKPKKKVGKKKEKEDDDEEADEESEEEDSEEESDSDEDEEESNEESEEDEKPVSRIRRSSEKNERTSERTNSDKRTDKKKHGSIGKSNNGNSGKTKAREKDTSEDDEDEPEPVKAENVDIKECFASTEVYDASQKTCYKCHLFEQCGDVIEGIISEDDAVKLLTEDKKSSKQEKPTNVSSKFGKFKKL